MLYFWSNDGIQIFSINLVFNLLIGQHLIYIFFLEIHQNWTGTTNFKFGLGELVNFPSLVSVSLQLVMMIYNLSVVCPQLVLIASPLAV